MIICIHDKIAIKSISKDVWVKGYMFDQLYKKYSLRERVLELYDPEANLKPVVGFQGLLEFQSIRRA